MAKNANTRCRSLWAARELPSLPAVSGQDDSKLLTRSPRPSIPACKLLLQRTYHRLEVSTSEVALQIMETATLVQKHGLNVLCSHAMIKQA